MFKRSTVIAAALGLALTAVPSVASADEETQLPMPGTCVWEVAGASLQGDLIFAVEAVGTAPGAASTSVSCSLNNGVSAPGLTFPGPAAVAAGTGTSNRLPTMVCVTVSANYILGGSNSSTNCTPVVGVTV